MLIIDQCRDYKMTCDKYKDVYIVITGGTKREFSNPLEAWTYYWQRSDMMMRTRIGDMLESQGRDRYTGEEKIQIDGC